ncbi:MAG: DUF1501 domain-containing protein [Burkholderiales bacterium]
MNRREFISTCGAASVAVALPSVAGAQQAAGRYNNLLILVELKGGNDGLNTVVPYADAGYYSVRPRLAVARDQVLQLDTRTGLHPSLAPLLPLWQARELAVVQGVGYPQANLSHFRSIEIWDTASKSSEYLADGWLARAFAGAPVPRNFAADGVIVGGNEMGPLAGTGTRAIALANPDQFLKQARLAAPAGVSGNAALSHILKVEQDIVQAASGLSAGYAFRTDFPQGAFGNAVRAAMQVVASRAPVAAIRVTLNGFDTHANQMATQQRLLKELAEGMAALKGALVELERWNSTLVMTYAEFGRRPRENQSGGTDHGTANAHFVAGGRVKGGLYGAPPALDRLDGNGNLPFAVDFRDLYATVLERWWSVSSQAALNGRYAPLELVRA